MNDARKALEEIANHWALSYDAHGAAESDSQRQYQIGVTDGHRLCAEIARKALAAAAPESAERCCASCAETLTTTQYPLCDQCVENRPIGIIGLESEEPE